MPGDLPDSIYRVGTVVVQGFVWALLKDDSHPAYQAAWGVTQAVELAVLCAGIATAAIRVDKPMPQAESAEWPQPDNPDVQGAAVSRGLMSEAAETWRWLAVILAGTCAGLIEEAKDPYGSGSRSWDIAEQALSGAAACMLAALGALDTKPCSALDDALEWPVSRLCEMADELKANTPDVAESHVYIR